MGYLYVEYTSVRDPSDFAAGSPITDQRMIVAEVPRLRWFIGFPTSEGLRVFAETGERYAIVNDVFGEYELRIEGISPNRPEEDSSTEPLRSGGPAVGGYTGDAFGRLSRIVSLVEQAQQFSITLDDSRSKENPATTPRRRTEVPIMRSVAAGDTTIYHLDKYFGGSTTGGISFDGFAAGDRVFIEDYYDPTRFEFNEVDSITGAQELELKSGLSKSYVSGSLMRHAFYFPSVLGKSASFLQRSGPRSPAAEVWDFTLRFVTLRDVTLASFAGF